MNKNSIKAYTKIKPDLPKMEDAVFNVILMVDRPISCEEIAERLNLFPNHISGRITKLKGEECGLIRVWKVPGKTRGGNACDLYVVDHKKLKELGDKILEKAA